MKIIIQDKEYYVLRFDNGDEVIGQLTKFCEEQHVAAGSFQALGATNHVVLAYYNMDTKQYEDHEYHEFLEIVNVVGNVAQLEGAVVLHAHGTFGNQQLQALAGHIKKMVVSATCEVVIQVFAGTMERRYNASTGLNLLV